MDMASNQEITRQVSSWFHEQGYTPTQVDEIERFFEVLMKLYPLDEFEGQSVEDIAGLVKSLYEFSQFLPPGEPRIQVFNPTLEEHGWQSRETLIFILQRDMAFIVDSVRMALDNAQFVVHNINSSIFRVRRNPQGQMLDRFADPDDQQAHNEALIYFQISRVSSVSEQQQLVTDLHSLLDDIRVINQDFPACLAKLDEIVEEVKCNYAGLSEPDLRENLLFLEWVKNNNFTFLGYSKYQLLPGEDPLLHHIEEGQLGLFRHHPKKIPDQPVSELSSGFREFYNSDLLVTLTRSSKRSSIHRDAYREYIVIKRFDEQGKLMGEHRLMGLYTSRVYAQSPFGIPLVRQKLHRVYQRSGLKPGSHDGKDLRQIIDTYPREELLYGTQEQLFETLIAIWQIKQRRVVRLFVRPDQFGKFVSCVVYIPREQYNSDVRSKTQDMLLLAFNASECRYNTYFDESILARTHFLLRTNGNAVPDVDIRQLEKKISLLTQSWKTELQEEIFHRWGEAEGRGFVRNFQMAFPPSYQSHFSPQQAVADIALCCNLKADDICLVFFKSAEREGTYTLKVFHLHEPLELSGMVPQLENMGFRVLGEHPYHLMPAYQDPLWMQAFTLEPSLDISDKTGVDKGNFEQAFRAVWQGKLENDSFNQLVLAAGLSWQWVTLMRMYARYMKQLGISLGQKFIAQTLVSNPVITSQLVALFEQRFDPQKDNVIDQDALKQEILEGLDSVANLNQDQVLRGYLELICATVRTSFFSTDVHGAFKPYVAIKLLPGELSMAPEPRPAYEIFVYSPRAEGVHLRSSKVARGGIRWSDRLEDYRTEVLGLVKAQQVKNAVIVPTGAKGGFVAKNTALQADRQQWQKEGIACYKLFVGALLELTDNLVDGKVEPAENVVRLDGDDAYLVVAADKGTASFSDIANQVSVEHKHWLGDAFASGGSYGYDHKKMGITARGAWVAVQRHFRELGLNTQQEDFTVVGIGDMAGDVFGNGMLSSPHIKLVAAFNHLHIFLDPDPDPEKSFAERKRLFDAALGWGDYDHSLISAGGGVYNRAAKSIPLTDQVRKVLGVDASQLTPDRLISEILKAPVDLLWNGGIGTYVKSIRESHQEVGDRANDGLRVNGKELRCRVVGEGGNLGITQLGRIEYCQNGGACNTDFIDNAGGVDCSDIEVNVKITLNQLVATGQINLEQRNQFLESMTDEVAGKVLSHNYSQTLSISLAQVQSRYDSSAFYQCMLEWEMAGLLNRKLEKLPSEEELADREKAGIVLTRPELSVLVSYAKNLAKQALAGSTVVEEPYFSSALCEAFPNRLRETYTDAIQSHPLRRQIIANRVVNEIVDRMGLTFFHRQAKSTGADAGEIVRAYRIVSDTFRLSEAWEEIERLDYTIDSELQMSMLLVLMRLGRRTTRWILRNRRQCVNATGEIKALKSLISEFLSDQELLLVLNRPDVLQEAQQRYRRAGLGSETANLLANAGSLFFVLGMADICLQTGLPMKNVASAYHALAEELSVNWVSEQIASIKIHNRWEDYARESYMDELEALCRALLLSILENLPSKDDIPARLEAWKQSKTLLIQRWQGMVADLHAASSIDFAMYSVAVRELQDLVSATSQDQSLQSLCVTDPGY